MRTIKFRARRKNGEWVVGNFIHHFATCFKNKERYSIFLPKPKNDNDGYWVEDIEPQTIGQFTGLKDKNGKEIYEGDVLKQVKKSSREGCESSSYDKNNFEVVFKYGSFWLQRPYSDSVYIRDFPNIDEFVGFECFEIVGNIYENPELLETEL